MNQMNFTKTVNKKTVNYKTWSFRFLIYLILLNALVAYIIVTSTTLLIESEGFEKPKNNSELYFHILTILTNILLILGIILTIISILKKEQKDYKYIFSIIGYSIFLILAIITIIWT